MNILVACEESQRVATELNKRGHNAFSCDIIPCSGSHPEYHIMADVLPLLNGNTSFITEDGVNHAIIGNWDMIIAFPPCTHLAVSGARYFEKKRQDGRQRNAVEFFCKILSADCEKISVENPVNIISGDYVKHYFPELAEEYGLPLKPSQIIQPYMFGDHARKRTCLWLKGLPKLNPTLTVDPGSIMPGGYSVNAGAYYVKNEHGKALKWNDPETAKQRSKTFPGVALAMAEQWT